MAHKRYSGQDSLVTDKHTPDGSCTARGTGCVLSAGCVSKPVPAGALRSGSVVIAVFCGCCPASRRADIKKDLPAAAACAAAEAGQLACLQLLLGRKQLMTRHVSLAMLLNNAAAGAGTDCLFPYVAVVFAAVCEAGLGARRIASASGTTACTLTALDFNRALFPSRSSCSFIVSAGGHADVALWLVENLTGEGVPEVGRGSWWNERGEQRTHGCPAAQQLRRRGHARVRSGVLMCVVVLVMCGHRRSATR
jgi:hypothetical protein